MGWIQRVEALKGFDGSNTNPLQISPWESKFTEQISAHKVSHPDCHVEILLDKPIERPYSGECQTRISFLQNRAFASILKTVIASRKSKNAIQKNCKSPMGIYIVDSGFYRVHRLSGWNAEKNKSNVPELQEKRDKNKNFIN